jgi:hypothetical protein
VNVVISILFRFVDWLTILFFFFSHLDGNEVVYDLEFEDKYDNDVQCNKK